MTLDPLAGYSRLLCLRLLDEPAYGPDLAGADIPLFTARLGSGPDVGKADVASSSDFSSCWMGFLPHRLDRLRLSQTAGGDLTMR